MLTKDRIPIIYHDFQIELEAKRNGTTINEKINIAIKDLTLSQLEKLEVDKAKYNKHE